MFKLLVLLLGVILLLFLISYFKQNTFVALIITSLAVGLGLGIPLDKIFSSIEKGIGETIGELTIVFGFGAMLGSLVANAGGAYRISHTMIQLFGKKYLQIAVLITTFIIGISLFFEVSVVVMFPIIAAIALEAEVPLVYLGLPMMAAISVTHGFLPPHPAPTAIANMLGANVGKVLLYGIMIGIPTVLICGPLFTKIAKHWIPSAFQDKSDIIVNTNKKFQLEKTPPFGISIVTCLMPVILMMTKTIYQLVFNNGIFPSKPTLLDSIINFIGNPATAMTISLLFSMYSMGYARNIFSKEINQQIETSVKSIAMLLLIVGGGGAFKQVLIDGGIGNIIKNLFIGANLSPLLLGWLIAAILKIALGSATVAALTAGGLILPLIKGGSINPNLMVLAIGSGSVIASHFNASGFWMVKEYFRLTIKETLLTWTIQDTLISLCGLSGVLVLNLFFH
ncbi:MAG: gluconate permease [Lactobacillus sp.]|nr:gluconate permease [Lactobacillus sp.]